MTGEDVYRDVTLADLPRVARAIAGHMSQIPVWAFHGDLGAGKTTLIKALGAELGVDDVMSSPTFAIVNEYRSAQFGKVFHFDFYRIRSEEEALEIGINEYFDSGYPCLIEWPDKIPTMLPQERGDVTLVIETEQKRTIAISLHVGKEENRV